MKKKTIPGKRKGDAPTGKQKCGTPPGHPPAGEDTVSTGSAGAFGATEMVWDFNPAEEARDDEDSDEDNDDLALMHGH